MPTRHAEIAGAGLGGLAASVALAQRGWSVRIHERGRFAANVRGRDLAVGERPAVSGRPGCRRTGHQAGASDRDARRPRPQRPRADAPRLRRSGPAGAAAPGRPVRRPDRAGRGTRRRHRHRLPGGGGQPPRGTGRSSTGPCCAADLVIAADGAFSRVRESLLLTQRVDYLDEGYTRLLIPRRESDPPTEITEYWSGSRRLLYDPCTDDLNYVCLCCNVDDEDGAAGAGRWEHLAAVLPRARRDHRADRRGGPVGPRAAGHLPRWSRGRAVVVGDAAHAQPPNLGQGANLTFQNALALAEYLDRDSRPGSRRAAMGTPGAAADRPRPALDELYGRAASAWPDRFARQRSQFLERASRVPGWTGS